MAYCPDRAQGWQGPRGYPEPANTLRTTYCIPRTSMHAALYQMQSWGAMRNPGDVAFCVAMQKGMRTMRMIGIAAALANPGPADVQVIDSTSQVLARRASLRGLIGGRCSSAA